VEEITEEKTFAEKNDNDLSELEFDNNEVSNDESNPDSELPKKFSMSLIRTMQPVGSEFNLFKNVIHLLAMCLQDL